MPYVTNSLLARRCKDGLSKFTNYNYRYPYQTVLPPELKNEVSKKRDDLPKPPCLQEISLMLACLQSHEFEEIHCSKEIEAFYLCQKNWKPVRGAQVTHSGRYPSVLVNSVLKKYPQPMKKKP